MRVRIDELNWDRVASTIAQLGYANLTEFERSTFDRCLFSASHVWLGFADDELACIWGVCPPSILSDQAYLWLWTNENVKGNEFLFIRHSQRAVEKMLELFPILYGHVAFGAEGSKRWLRFLGARFGEPGDKAIPFQIRAQIDKIKSVVATRGFCKNATSCASDI